MALLMLCARVLFAVFFVDSGINNLRNRDALAKRLAGPAMPALIRRYPEFFNLGSTGLLVVGSVMLTLGIYPDLGALALAVFLVPVTLTTHPYWTAKDPVVRRQQRMAFLRNVSFFGACLFFFSFFAAYGHGLPFTVTDALFSLR